MSDFLVAAESVAREAGDLMRSHFGIGVAHTLKVDRSPVTEVDQRVNDLVITRLSEQFPDHSLLGEEGGRTTESEYVWVFDPIDGTVPYLRGVPTNVFSLALVHDGEPVLGVVYDPYQDRLYRAVKGEGSFLNNEQISIASATDLLESFVAIEGRTPFKDLSFLERLRERQARFLSYNSTVYGQMLVASGQIEGAIYAGNKPWDQAAAKVIIEEAGGVTSSIRGENQRYDGSIDGFISACTPEYHQALLTLVAASLT